MGRGFRNAGYVSAYFINMMKWMVTCMCVSLGTYRGSYTWFEACILRPVPYPSGSGSTSDSLGPAEVFLQEIEDGPLDWSFEDNDSDSLGTGFTLVEVDGRKRWHIQRNVHVSLELKDHEVVWTERDGGPARNELEVNDDTGTGNGWGFVRALRAGDRIAVLARALVRPFE